MTDSTRPRGCGNPACRSCVRLKGVGPWCPRCGADMYAERPNEDRALVWAPVVCASCSADPLPYPDDPPRAMHERTGMQTMYRFYDRLGRCLYIGITARSLVRWVQHASSKPWWYDVANAKVDHFTSREDALAAERAAIEAEDPIHNVDLKR